MFKVTLAVNSMPVSMNKWSLIKGHVFQSKNTVSNSDQNLNMGNVDMVLVRRSVVCSNSGYKYTVNASEMNELWPMRP